MATWLDAIGIGLAAIRSTPHESIRQAEESGFGVPRHRSGHNSGKALAGRLSKRGPALVQTPGQLQGATLTDVVGEPPLNMDERWRAMNLDRNALDRMSTSALLEMMCELSPDISRALWDFLRMTNPGWEAIACRIGTDKKLATADTRLQAFLAELKDYHGSFDLIINRLFIGAFLRGAFLGELVLDARGRAPLDIATPDPATIRFRTKEDPARGTVYEMGQIQGFAFVPIERETVRYVPIDPMPGSPYGRPLATPALFSTLFLLQLLHDIKRVVAQQGYPRIDIEINMDALKAVMPANLEDDPVAFEEWVNGAISQVEQIYRNLEPDDAYVHTSVIKINRPVGTVDANSLGAVSALINSLERMAVRALKTMPLMMGITDGISEANANRQWEIYSAGIKALQHLCESLLEHLLTKAMQAQGVACTVVFRFAELRAAEMLRDEQTNQFKYMNIGTLYDRGWISQNEAAQLAVGHAPDAPEPRDVALQKEQMEAANTLAEKQADAQTKAAEAAAEKAKADAAAAAKPDDTSTTNAGGEGQGGDDPPNGTADTNPAKS
jgi:hypothetical protein